MTFDATDKINILIINGAATNRSDKKRAQSVFGRGNVKPIFGDKTCTSELAVSLSKLTQDLERN